MDLVAVSGVRAVETERVPRALIDSLSERLIGELGRSTVRLEVDDLQCFREDCRLEAAQAQGAAYLLHTRLVQYAGNCALLSVQYEVASKKSNWGFARELPCEASGLRRTISDLAETYALRTPREPELEAFAITPVQHRVDDLAWASESWGEVLSTLYAASGRATIAASLVAQPLDGFGGPPHRSCAESRCPIDLAASVIAQKAVATKIRRRRRSCTVTTTVYDVQSRRSVEKSTARGGCEANEIAASLTRIASELATALPPPAAAAPMGGADNLDLDPIDAPLDDEEDFEDDDLK